MSVKPSSNVKPLDPCEEFAQRGVYQKDQCRDALVHGTNSYFPAPLVSLIMQHLPPIAPTMRNWETEWTWLVGRDVVWFVLNQAGTPFSDEELVTTHTVTGKEVQQFTLQRDRSCLDIINDYLGKSNKYDSERIEK